MPPVLHGVARQPRTEPADRRQRRAAGAGLAAKVAFLRLPGSFPEATCRVEARETRRSWVFLLDTCVHELKKPVRFYKSYRSTSRGHMALRHLDEPHLRHPGHWRQRATHYLQLAKSHIDEAGAAWPTQHAAHRGQVK